MVAGSILPVTIHNNKLLFLFGKENPLETSAKGWSDFGGGLEKNETPFQCALREGSEELSGFLGDSQNIKKIIEMNGGVYKLVLNDYHVHIFYLKYDEYLVKYYNQNHKFLWKSKQIDNQILKDSCLFEKIEIDWFSVKDIKNGIHEFRSFYQDIIRLFLSEITNIETFIRKKSQKKRYTLKQNIH